MTIQEINRSFYACKKESFYSNAFAHQTLDNGAAKAITDRPAGKTSGRLIIAAKPFTLWQEITKHHPWQLRSVFSGLVIFILCLAPFTGSAQSVRVWYSDGKYYYADLRTGKAVIKLDDCDNASDFQDGIAAVHPKSKGWGGIDSTGKMVIPPIYAKEFYFENGFAKIYENNKYSIINKAGKVIAQDYDDVYIGREMISVMKGKKWGGIDKDGNIVLPFVYESGLYFFEGLASVSKKGKHGYINMKGEVVIPFDTYDHAYSFGNGLANVGKNGVSYFINKEGKKVFEHTFQEAYRFCEGLICMKVNGLYGYADTLGNVVIPPRFTEARNFSENLAYVKTETSKCFINRSGKCVIDLPKYATNISNFNHGIAKYEADYSRIFIASNGEILTGDSVATPVELHVDLWDLEGYYKLESSGCNNALKDFTLRVIKDNDRGEHSYTLLGLGDNGYGDKNIHIKLYEEAENPVVKCKETQLPLEGRNGNSGQAFGVPFFIGKDQYFIKWLSFHNGTLSFEIYYETKGEVDYATNKYNYKALTCRFYGKR